MAQQVKEAVHTLLLSLSTCASHDHLCESISSLLRVFFLPADIQHTQRPRRFFMLERHNVQALWS